jgi:hypothetical protein
MSRDARCDALKSRHAGLDIDGDEEACMSTIPTPRTALPLDEINPASFDFWLRDDV